MNADTLLRAGVRCDLLYQVSTHEHHCVAHSALLWISAQLAEMLDCITAGGLQHTQAAELRKSLPNRELQQVKVQTYRWCWKGWKSQLLEQQECGHGHIWLLSIYCTKQSCVAARCD